MIAAYGDVTLRGGVAGIVLHPLKASAVYLFELYIIYYLFVATVEGSCELRTKHVGYPKFRLTSEVGVKTVGYVHEDYFHTY